MFRKFQYFILLILLISSAGCVSMTRQSKDFPQKISQVKTIAVLPVDVRVYQISAGGVQEEIDEWSANARKYIQDGLEKYLAGPSGVKIKFIDEKWLKENAKQTWSANKALYQAIAESALTHAYPGMETFESKVKNFDYTLGSDFQELAKLCEADAVIFVSGFDTEVTGGRLATEFWNQLLGAAVGVSIIYYHPTFLSLGVVDALTGDIVWFKVNNPQDEYNFRKENHVDKLVQWITSDLFDSKK